MNKRHIEKQLPGVCPIIGALKCFCDKEKKAKQPPSKTYADGKICEELMSEQFYNNIIKQTMGFAITGTNLFLKRIVVILVKQMGCHTESKQMIQTTRWVFLTNFLNTGFLLMLANANLQDQGIPVIRLFFRGPDSDFNSRWFDNVGETLVSAMILNIIIEPGTMLAMLMLRVFNRLLDAGAFKK